MFPKSILLRLVYVARYALPTLVLAALLRRPKTDRSSPTPPNLLVTRLDLLGDFLMDTPLLRELRRNYPRSHITLVAGEKVGPLARACPYVDEVFVLHTSPRLPSFQSRARYLLAVASYLKYLVTFTNQNLAGRIDIAINPRWEVDLEGAMLVLSLSGAPSVIGYSEKTSLWKSWCNFGYDHLLTHVLAPGPTQHMTERALDIIRYLGGSVESTVPEVWWRPEDQLQADRFLADHGLSQAKFLLALGVGASEARRHWPFFADLIDLLGRNLAFTPLILAGPGEERIAREIAARSKSAIVLQSLPLGTVASVLSRCNLFIGNDSGPMHLAAAVGLPVVEISCHPLGGAPDHINSPERTGPYTTRKSVVRPKVFLGNCRGGCMENAAHCITGISPEEVAAAAMQWLPTATEHLRNISC